MHANQADLQVNNINSVWWIVFCQPGLLLLWAEWWGPSCAQVMIRVPQAQCEGALGSSAHCFAVAEGVRGTTGKQGARKDGSGCHCGPFQWLCLMAVLEGKADLPTSPVLFWVGKA